MNELKFLEDQGVAPVLIKQVERFRAEFPVPEEVAGRVVKPAIPFYGKDILEMSIAALLQGQNLLLTGPKATGKNILAENLAYIFNRPSYNISFHVNTNSGDLIGTDTFEDNKVKLRKGSIYRCAEHGGFGILDEINMAKNDAVSVLHATLDYRRSIDVPGYDKIDLHPAARFIGTMNYGYAGTVCLDVPEVVPIQIRRNNFSSYREVPLLYGLQYKRSCHIFHQDPDRLSGTIRVHPSSDSLPDPGLRTYLFSLLRQEGGPCLPGYRKKDGFCNNPKYHIPDLQKEKDNREKSTGCPLQDPSDNQFFQ